MAGLGHPNVPGEAENAEVDDYMADLSVFVPVAEEQLPIKPQVIYCVAVCVMSTLT